jgi:hypothetical protein
VLIAARESQQLTIDLLVGLCVVVKEIRRKASVYLRIVSSWCSFIGVEGF